MDEYKSIENLIVIVYVRFTMEEVIIACWNKKEEWLKENQMKKTMHWEKKSGSRGKLRRIKKIEIFEMRENIAFEVESLRG